MQSVVPGGPADQAGIRPGDIITEVNGRPVSSIDNLTAIQLTSEPGDTVEVTYERDGQTQLTAVTLGAG